MPRAKKYSPKGFKTACRKYFASISRIVTVNEMIPTGQRDRDGHEITVPVPIKNFAGEEIKKVEFAVPPTITGLCRYLHITRHTWESYSEDEDFRDICDEVRERLREWNEEQLLTRPGKDVRGIIFNLQNNYGYSEKQELELGPAAASTIQTASMTMAEKAELLEKLKKQAFGEGDT